MHIQNKPQANGSPNTQILRRPLTSPRAWCQVALAPTRGTLRLTLWQARHTHRAGVAESRPPATTAQTPGFALESVSQDFKAQTGPAQPSSACWGHGQAPLCVPAQEWEGQGGSLPPTQRRHPLVPRKAWAGGSRLELGRIKLTGTKGRRGLPLLTQLGNSCGPQEGFTPQACPPGSQPGKELILGVRPKDLPPNTDQRTGTPTSPPSFHKTKPSPETYGGG